jgi:predicted CXXCH cytochrome family protein
MNRYINRLGVVALAIVVAGAMGYAATIDTSVHDLSATGGGVAHADPNTGEDEICIFCHTPHNSGVATLLWDHTATGSTNYTMYTSGSLDASITAFAMNSGVASALCMSCHDGTIAINDTSSIADPTITTTDPNRVDGSFKIVGNKKVGVDLSNDHPVNFTYDTTLATNDGDLTSPISTLWVDAIGSLPLFAGTMQCASCHDPHDNANGNFLIIDNAGSDLCQTCHTK